MDRKGARLLCAYRAGDVTNQSNNGSDAIPIDKAPPYLHFMEFARKFAAIGVKITSASLFMRYLPVKVYGLALHRETRETLLETLLDAPIGAIGAAASLARARARLLYRGAFGGYFATFFATCSPTLPAAYSPNIHFVKSAQPLKSAIPPSMAAVAAAKHVAAHRSFLLFRFIYVPFRCRLFRHP